MSIFVAYSIWININSCLIGVNFQGQCMNCNVNNIHANTPLGEANKLFDTFERKCSIYAKK